MNYAALLGLLAAATFTLPLLARLAEMLGLHRNAGVAASLVVATLAAAAWYVKASQVRARPAERRAGTDRRGAAGGSRVDGGSSIGPVEEDDAGIQGHR